MLPDARSGRRLRRAAVSDFGFNAVKLAFNVSAQRASAEIEDGELVAFGHATAQMHFMAEQDADFIIGNPVKHPYYRALGHTPFTSLKLFQSVQNQ